MFCLVAFLFLFASILTMAFANIYGDHTKFMELLDENQKKKYVEIKNIRKRAHLMGSVLGLILALIAFYNIQTKLSGNLRGCIFASVFFIVQYLTYNYYPKGPLMVTYLDKEEQRKAWGDVYYHMKHMYMSGAVLGVLAFYFFGRYMCGCGRK